MFAFDGVSILAEPAPGDIGSDDVRWSLEVSRRQSKLFANASQADPDWLLEAACFMRDTGHFAEAQRYAKKAINALGVDQSRLKMKALLVRCNCFLAIRNGGMASRCLREIERLATPDDPCTTAIYHFAKGNNLQENPLFAKFRTANSGLDTALPLFELAIPELVEAREIDLAIRCLVESAQIRFQAGKFFVGIETIDQATSLAQTYNCWGSIGRLLTVYAGTCGDQGYRRGVMDVLHRALEWCNYLGDKCGRIESLLAIGRLMGFQMPYRDLQMALEADQYLQEAADEASRLGLVSLIAAIDFIRSFIFSKAGHGEQISEPPERIDGESEVRKKLASKKLKEADSINEAIRRNTALRLHDGVEDAHEAFFVYDALRDSKGQCQDFNGVYVNCAARRIYELSGSQVFLYSEAQWIPHLSGLEVALIQALEERKSFEDIHRIDDSEKSLWLQRRVVPSGEGAVVTLRDVTAEKSIETALRHAAESAERSERTKTAFLASMSHEIRTPLNGVIGLARILAESNLEPTDRSYVDDIVLSGDILLELIGDILDLSKIEAREMSLTLAAVPLEPLVASIVKLFQGQAREHGTTLSFQILPGVPGIILADGIRLRQILANLVGNAIKFTSTGLIEVLVHVDKGLLVFEVRDTGIGIPAEQIETIFDRFQQAGPSVYRGSGLGLTITKALLDLMEGSVTVVSEVGIGSTFIVRIPLRLADGLPSNSEGLGQAGPRNCRVLLVDDNQINLIVSAHALQKLGCEVTCAENGLEALDHLKMERFDLVFMDVRMPVLDGLQVTRQFRALEDPDHRTPIVALTAGALLQEQQECFDAGMNDFVTKPIALEAIQDVLTKWLPASLTD